MAPADALRCLCYFSPSLSCSVPLGYIGYTHTHILKYEQRDKGGHPRHRKSQEVKGAAKEGGEEGPCEDRKWLGGAAPGESKEQH